MTHAAQNLLRLVLVVVDTRSVAPATRGKQQGHRKILFPVRSWTSGARRPVRIHRPGEVAHVGILRVGDEHVGI